MTWKGQALCEGCKQFLSFVTLDSCGLAPGGSAVHQMGCLANGPLHVQQLSASREKSSQNILLSHLPGVSKKAFLCSNNYLNDKAQIGAFWVIKCLNVDGWIKC